ncbi:twin-arginine translocation signal domain-containing protein [Pyxidicoccus trucidator]|uniref:twin-arginine translocation signal domain-containing protein n=1 Tax=Pyxidicoccus trucidator TaxID=2709662 RepID=UPI0013DCF057|nr:twin-arginine translocation signal domain-containing protein [Pyxidicoccus trucidator]
MSDRKNVKPPEQQPESTETADSRRGFLGKLGLGAAAVVAAAAPGTAQAQEADCNDPAQRAREIVTAFNFNLAAGHKMSKDQVVEMSKAVDETIKNAVVRDVIGTRLKEYGLIEFNDINEVASNFSLHINVSW